jgi:DNA polymerase-3 subunit gamma/tau
MESETLYRKWRPQKFSEVVGQKHVVQTLVNAVEAGRISHAYLFTGTRGTGKTSVARILAKSINCLEGPTANPCEKCPPCQEIKNGSFLDVIEIDAASNRGIDDVRALREQLYYSPSQGKYKVYIIDEVHMLTPEASNALLKVLEEPPAKTVFVLATTEAHKVLPTILSRCQRFDFRRLAPEEVFNRLKQVAKEEGIKAEESALWAISSFSQGSLRDALVMLEQGAFYSPGGLKEEEVLFLLGKSPEKILESLTDFLLRDDFSGFLKLTEELHLKGYSFKNLLNEMLDYFYALLLKQEAGVEPKIYPSVSNFENKFPSFLIGEAMEVLSEAVAELRYQENSYLVWESAFFKIFKLLGFQFKERPQLKKIGEKKKEKDLKPLQEKEEVYFSSFESPSSSLEKPSVSSKKEVAESRKLNQNFNWEEVLKEVKSQKPSLYFMLLNARFVSFDGETICLSFKPENRFHFKEVSSRPNLDRIENICQKLSGKKIKIKCQLKEEAKEGKEKMEPEKEKITRFLEEFEAEPVSNPDRKEGSYESE